jgi:hypothetical protein
MAWLVEQQIYGESIRKINAEERPMASRVLALVHPKIARDPEAVGIRRVGDDGVDRRGRQVTGPVYPVRAAVDRKEDRAGNGRVGGPIQVRRASKINQQVADVTG